MTITDDTGASDLDGEVLDHVVTPTTGGRVIGLGDLIGFIVLHVGAVAAIAIVGFSWGGLGLFLGTYVVRTWAICAGFHRYFSHRSFTTSRGVQFVIGGSA